MRNDRWSNTEEIKKVLIGCDEHQKIGGPILYHSNGQSWLYGGEGHTLILGVSGSGKSRRGTIPMARSFIYADESFVIVDPKGEIYRQTANYTYNNYNIHVIDFRNIFDSERWNVLTVIYELFSSKDPTNKQIAIEKIDELAYVIYPSSDKVDPFWIDSARSLFIAVIYAIMEHAKPEEVNMFGVYWLIANGDKTIGPSNLLKEFVSLLPVESPASMMLQSYITTANDTRAGIRSVFLEGLSIFVRSEGLVKLLGTDDIHISSLDVEVPTGIYIIIPDESPIFDKLAGVLVSQLMSHYVRLAEDKYQGKLPNRLNVCIEELGNVGKAIINLPHLMSAGRSRNIRVQLVLQSLSQLVDIYGVSNATTITSNADLIIAFRTNHWDTLSELSRKCGEREINIEGHIFREPLITQSQLAAMQTGQALVMISGYTKFITWIPDYSELYDCSNWEYPIRKVPNKSINKPGFFDVTEYVKSAKRRKMNSGAIHTGEIYLNERHFDDFPISSNEDMNENYYCQDTPHIDFDEMIERINSKIADIESENQPKS